MASIAVRQFKLGNLPFAHNFLVRYDDNGNIVGELHGFAIDPNTNERKAIGRSSDYLRAREPALGDRFYAEGQPEQILWQGPEEDAAAHWTAARQAGDQINNRNLTYNLWGSDLNGPKDWDAPVPDVIAGNSNSVNSTLVDAMGLRLPSMPYMARGIENPILRQQ